MNHNRGKTKNRTVPEAAGTAEKGGDFLRRITDRTITLILTGAMALGICLLAYPTFADYWNSFRQTKAVMAYADSIANMNTQEYDRILDGARAYNAGLAERGINWVPTDEERAAYNEQLNLDGEGVMGYINIRKINVTLPIYHGTNEDTLETSIGHLEQSSLPVGGESTHCMLSGHRGLPSARLFTDLDKLREGDTFTMTTLNETLTYEVDHIWIVDPDDLAHLQIEAGKDLCTLITCTPYGVNTHRLLVQGHRIENVDGTAMIVADAIQIRPVYIAPFLAVPILILLLIYVLICTGSRRRAPRDLKGEYLSENQLSGAEIMPDNTQATLDSIRNSYHSETAAKRTAKKRKDTRKGRPK